MTKFIGKAVLYILLILISLEMIVRLFHLYTEDPPRYIDKFGVEKRVSQNEGHAVYGNRNQVFTKFGINTKGFNSHREFLPTIDKFEVAITGDSFIEGFHQDYQNSIGIKIENKISDIEVYQYGYAAYDLANQLHLINSYKKEFELIDEIIVYLNFDKHLERGEYSPNYERVKMLNSDVFRIRDQFKLLAYGSKIGILEPLKHLANGAAFEYERKGYQTNEIKLNREQQKLIDEKYLMNFIKLIEKYGFDKSKTVLLLDSRKTSEIFLEYCSENNIGFIDFSHAFENSNRATTLIYDWHWNNHGRELIAQVISEYLKTKNPNLKTTTY